MHFRGVPASKPSRDQSRSCGIAIAGNGGNFQGKGFASAVDLVARQNYRDTFDAVPDPIVIARASDGSIVLVNREFERASGYSREDALGRTPIELGLWPNPSECERCVEVLASGADIRNLHITLRMKDGSDHPYLLSATSVWFHGEPCSMSVVRDVTELRKIEADLVAARDAAEAASRAKSEFLSSVSHEIRTPMNAILGMAELMAETDLTEEQSKYLTLMRNNGTALLTLINDVLDLARVERGRLQLEHIELDLDKVLRSVIESLAVRANEKRLALFGRIAQDVAPLRIGDPLRLRQVLVNLVGNAIKFTERGHIKVKISRVPGSEQMLHFAVRDTGIGIPPDKLGQIFQSFSQADSSTARRYGGSGLGLAIVARLVELMGGQVWAESEEAVGTTVHFTARLDVAQASLTQQPLPPVLSSTATMTPSAAPVAKPVAPTSAPEHPLSILVVDDSVDNRYLLRSFLKRLPYQLTEAENGQVAVDLATSRRFDLVLMDMQMPIMDGFTATRAIRDWEKRRDQPPAPIVALTASALHEDIGKCLAAGCDFHVSKPINKSTLLAAIQRATSGADLAPIADVSPIVEL